jgi:hypothetical protein
MIGIAVEPATVTVHPSDALASLAVARLVDRESFVLYNTPDGKTTETVFVGIGVAGR